MTKQDVLSFSIPPDDEEIRKILDHIKSRGFDRSEIIRRGLKLWFNKEMEDFLLYGETKQHATSR